MNWTDFANARSIDEDIEIPTNCRLAYGYEYCFTVGPEITINSSRTVTVPLVITWTIVETGLEPKQCW